MALSHRHLYCVKGAFYWQVLSVELEELDSLEELELSYNEAELSCSGFLFWLGFDSNSFSLTELLFEGGRVFNVVLSLLLLLTDASLTVTCKGYILFELISVDRELEELKSLEELEELDLSYNDAPLVVVATGSSFVAISSFVSFGISFVNDDSFIFVSFVLPFVDS